MDSVYLNKWLIALDGKIYIIELEQKINFFSNCKISVNGNVIIHKQKVLLVDFRFNIDTHKLRIKDKFFDYMLIVDGQECPSTDAIILTSQFPYASSTHSNDDEIQIVNEDNVHETMQILDVEEFPLDNSAGTATLQIDHEISKTVTNELTINTTSNLSGTVDLSLLNAIKAEISTNLQKNSGHKISETIGRRQTLHFTVPPRCSVIYIIIWKRKIRSAECTVFAQNKLHHVNYKANYDLTYEVKSK